MITPGEPVRHPFLPWNLFLALCRPAALILLFLLLHGCAGKEEAQPIIFYPGPPEQPRLQYLASISSEEDLEQQHSSFDDFLLGPDRSFADIIRPYDIASSPGRLYVVDRQYDEIVIIDLVNNSFDLLESNWQGKLAAPAGIWVGNDDVKYVADMKRRQVVVFGADNAYLRAYGRGEDLAKPVDVAVHDNNVFVCDMQNHRIAVFDLESGELKKVIGGIGSGPGQLYRPTHIAIGAAGDIFVNDAFNFRVQHYDADGRFIGQIGHHGDRIGAMARSKGLDVDPDGNLYVADAAFEYVQIFDDEGRLLLFFGGPGTDPGNLYLPAGVHIDYANVSYFEKYADKLFKIRYLLFVCNMSGQRKLNVYGFGDWLGN